MLISYLKFPSDHSKRSRVKVGCREDLVELGLFLLERVCERAQLLLQQQVLEVTLLLNLVDRLHKLPVQIVPLILRLKNGNRIPTINSLPLPLILKNLDHPMMLGHYNYFAK